jgi:transcriptional regulator GlxA family with amidase domain
MTPDRVWERGSQGLEVAIVAYHGVLADETDAFREVLTRIPGARLVTVGEDRGSVAGPGGAQEVEERFADLSRADVVVVPGGLGTHRHPEIALWLRRVRPRWILASSTGTALLAAAGLLRQRIAATHWLAGPLLERYGAIPSTERLIVDRPFVTCSGLASAFDAAFVVADEAGGPLLVRRIRQQLAELANEPSTCQSPRTKYRSRPARRVATPAQTAPASAGGGRHTTFVEVELEDHPPDPRRDS